MKRSRLGLLFIAFALLAILFAWLWWRQTIPLASKPAADQEVAASAARESSASNVSVASEVAVAGSLPEVAKLPGVSQVPGILLAPEAEKFDMAMLEDHAALAQYLSAAQHKQALALLKTQYCKSPRLTVYFKKDVAEKLLLSDCYYSLFSDSKGNPDNYDAEYGIMLAVDKTTVLELKDIIHYKFMYETSKLSAVTKSDKSGGLQLWLDGLICENDGSDNDEDEPVGALPGNAVSASASMAQKSAAHWKAAGPPPLWKSFMVNCKR
ncbi:hypothetical protein ACO0LC_10915 [Undibacterium sp. JH2W]|uniref:hypothetical protein n=1 Tax=Undibacterium sp. JH2W TaxID=3413037 RepID=UPI003BF3BA34